jgi:hypothetical protein
MIVASVYVISTTSLVSQLASESILLLLHNYYQLQRLYYHHLHYDIVSFAAKTSPPYVLSCFPLK